MTLFDADHMRVILEDVIVEAYCGRHPWERHPERPSRLKISIDLYLKIKTQGPITDRYFVDYDPIRDFLRAFPARPHTDLLETLVDEITAKCFDNDHVEACRVRILKPDIFNETAGAGIEVFRTRDGWN